MNTRLCDSTVGDVILGVGFTVLSVLTLMVILSAGYYIYAYFYKGKYHGQ